MKVYCILCLQNAITAAGHFTSLLVETLISVMFAVTMYCALQDESWGVWARVFGFMGGGMSHRAIARINTHDIEINGFHN